VLLARNVHSTSTCADYQRKASVLESFGLRTGPLELSLQRLANSSSSKRQQLPWF
jgi:hypothetical protein